MAAPLFGRVALDERLVKFRPHLREDPLFQVAWVFARHAHLGQFPLGLGRRGDAPQLMQCHQVDRKGKHPAVEIHFDVMAVVIEPCKAVHKLPYAGVAGVKDVRAVSMNIDPLDALGIAIAADVATLVDQHHAAAVLCHDPRIHGAEHATADDKIIEAHAIAGIFIGGTHAFFKPRLSMLRATRADGIDKTHVGPAIRSRPPRCELVWPAQRLRSWHR